MYIFLCCRWCCYFGRLSSIASASLHLHVSRQPSCDAAKPIPFVFEYTWRLNERKRMENAKIVYSLCVSFPNLNPKKSNAKHGINTCSPNFLCYKIGCTQWESAANIVVKRTGKSNMKKQQLKKRHSEAQPDTFSECVRERDRMMLEKSVKWSDLFVNYL